jgi:tetratricopeptide (TPR) repeat protein
VLKLLNKIMLLKISNFILFATISASLLLVLAFAQKPTPKPKKSDTKSTPKVKPTKTPVAIDENAEFEAAKSTVDASERVNSLRKFKSTFPNSERNNRVAELTVSAFAELGENSFVNNDVKKGIEFFKLAVKEIPNPVSDQLFVNVILQFPTNLFIRGQKAEAVDLAKSIESKIGDNPKYLLGLATFYLGIENPETSKILAEKAIAADPNSYNAYQTLGLANRMNFDLPNAESAYSKALQLDPESIVSKRSLAEIKRSNAKSLEAETLYREILEKTPEDRIAKTGLILAMFDNAFDTGKKSQAEVALKEFLEAFPKNLQLLVGVSYWYAANNDGEKAVEYGKLAVELEPRYVWSHIALARGLSLQNKPFEAERALLTAKQYGNFPTLNYELALTRFQAGLYEEAINELKTTFFVSEDQIETKLGGRVSNKADNFIDLLAPERRASIFQSTSADNLETSQKLKYLLDFSQKILKKESSESEISKLATLFSDGKDKNRTFRYLFVASRLLEKKLDPETVLKAVQAATSGLDSAISSPIASSAVLADEIIESRTAASARGETIIIPTLPRQTISNILRSRIEEISGWTFYQQNKFPEAIVRLKRASGIAPDKSAWWRSSTWRLGAAFDANGNQKEALENYLKVYKSADPNFGRRAIIEILYQKMNGSLDGLDAKLDEKSDSKTVAKVIPTPNATPVPTTIPAPIPTPTPEVVKSPEVAAKPEVTTTSNIPKIEQTDENNTEIRPRVVVSDETSGKQCTLTLTQESISLLSNGGRLGLLIVIRGEGKIEDMTATVSSPEDISVNLERDFIKGSNRGFYTFRSISKKTGEFKVTFELPCGKKEVLVKVR